MKKGLIIKSISGQYTIIDNDEKIYVCKPRGVFRHQEIIPKVGDRVSFDDKHNTIYEIEKRKNNLIRPFIANIDKQFIVFSVKEPVLNLNLLDRMLAISEFNDITSYIIFTKLDLFFKQNEITEYEAIKKYYQNIGYQTFESSLKEFSFDTIRDEVKDSICVFSGQSGVGKSTLLNYFDEKLKLKTNEISHALGRGRHTTRHVELLRLGDGWIADTPGFGIIDFDSFDLLSLSHSFVEFYQKAKDCKFSKCTHINEPDCAVKKAVEDKEILESRYQNYLLFATTIKEDLKNKY